MEETETHWWVRPHNNKKDLEVVTERGDIVATVYSYDSLEQGARRAALLANAPLLFDTVCAQLDISGRDPVDTNSVEVRRAKALLQTLKRY